MSKTRTSTFAFFVALAGSLALYGRALGLAFVNDDIAHLLTLADASLGEVAIGQWSAQGSAYFRPLGSLALWALLQLFGRNPLPFYALNIALHGLNVWLLWHGVRRLGGDALATCTALAWLVFPTHYEAVAYVAALFHPLSTLLILLAILALDQALERGSWHYWAATAALTMLAPLAHEQAVMLPALLIGWQALVRPPSRLRGWLRQPTPYLALLVIPVLAGRALLGGALTDALSPNLANTWAGLQHLSRLVAYPLAWFVGAWLPEGTAQAALGALLALAALALCCWRGCGRGALCGLGWLLITGAPVLLLIEARYLPSSPRLFYLPSIGITLFWASLAAALPRRRSWSGRALLDLWVGLICLAPLPYLSCAMDALERGSALVRALVLEGQASPRGRAVTVVNVPFYFAAPCRLGCLPRAYPYDAAGVVILPLYASVSDLIWVNGGPRLVVSSVSYAGYGPTWATHGLPTSALTLRQALERGEDVLVAGLGAPLVSDLGAAWRASQGSEANPYLAPLLAPSELALPEELLSARALAATWPGLLWVGVDMAPACLPGESLAISFYWRPEEALAGQDLEVSLRLYDRYGHVLAENTLPALAGYTPEQWEPGVAYATRGQLPVPAEAALGPGRVALRLVRRGQPLMPEPCTACDAEGWIAVGEVLIGRQEVVPAMDASAQPVGARWENGIHLEGWFMKGPDAAGQVQVTLYWRAEQPVDENLTVFLHLARPDGAPWAQDDGEPVSGQFPTSRWPAGALIADVRTLVWPAKADQAPLQLLVGLYRWPSLERLAVTPPEGGAPMDHLLLAELPAVRR